jgi:hypothetical protein
MVWEKINYKLNLGVSKLQAEDLLANVSYKVPFVKMLMDSVMKRAQDQRTN